MKPVARALPRSRFAVGIPWPAALAIIGATCCLAAPAHAEDWSDYRSVATAIAAAIQKENPASAGLPAYLGIEVVADNRGRLIVTSIAPDSPAAKAGFQTGDELKKLGKVPVRDADEVREWIRRQIPGTSATLTIDRARKTMQLTATFGATSRPRKLPSQRAGLGIGVIPQADGEGLRVTRVTKDLPAAKVGIRSNDVLLRIDGKPLVGSSGLMDMLSSLAPGDKVQVTYRRGNKESTVATKLARVISTGQGASSEPRRTWKNDTFRLAVICVEFRDTKHNNAISMAEWRKFFFSTNKYVNTTNATGQPVYGSVNDYYREVSCGGFHFTGKVFNWVRLKKSRAEYSQGTANSRTRAEFFDEVFKALLDREGADGLTNFDGLAIIYAGERYPTANRGTLFWPHRNNTTYKGNTWSYILCPEGGKQMGNISVFCHEFGHTLGLPDLYARPENPGSEGVGTWCIMSTESGGGRPQHFCAWSKEQLGWLNPVVIDPTVKQKLILSAIEGSTNECFKVLVRPDGSEYFLLENRRQDGFDHSLAAPGMLIWRVVGNRLILEESHGVEGPEGPRVFLGSVPYPSAANDAFTPFTTPSSRSQLGGGLPVNITNIRQLPDGRIAFQIGYEYE